MNLSDYVRVYDDAMPAQMCQSLIDRFEVETANQVKRDNALMKFNEINVNQSQWDMNEFYPLMLQYRQRYWQDCNIPEIMIDPNHGWEELRMKRYVPGTGEQFYPHNDAADVRSCHRFLVYFWYLNDVAEGGETVFYRLDRPMKVQPRQGRLIMFPVAFPYLHAGLEPISNNKYIVGGYLQYK